MENIELEIVIHVIGQSSRRLQVQGVGHEIGCQDFVTVHFNGTDQLHLGLVVCLNLKRGSWQNMVRNQETRIFLYP